MKKLTLLISLVCILTTYSYAQTENLDNLIVKKFNTCGVGLNVGFANSNGDASDNETTMNILSPKFNYDLYLSKQISHFTGLEFHYSGGKLGCDYSKYFFESRMRQIDGRLRINFTNGQILKDYSKTQIYGFVGFGMLNFKTTVDTFTYPSDWVHVIPVGVGVKKKLNSNTSLNLELAYNRANTDKLDGYKVNYTQKDGYTNIRIGVQYTLGKKKKPLEWDEALSYFKPLQEHSVDTLVLIKKEINYYKDTIKSNIESLTIYYDIGDYMINGIYREDLHQILTQLNKNPESSIELVAHCDSTGSEKTNYKLVAKRSRLVADFFINNDINSDRIRVYNYGPEFSKEVILSKDRKVIINYFKNKID